MSGEERGGYVAFWIAIVIGLMALSTLPGPSSAASPPNPCPLASGSVAWAGGGASSPRPLNPCPGFEWAKTYGTPDLNDQAWGLDLTNDGGAVVLVRTRTLGVTLVKVDGEGAVQWQKRFGEGSGPGGIRQTSDGGFIFAHQRSMGDPATAGIVVYRLDALGGVVWQAAYDGPGSDVAFSIAEVPAGGYVVGAETTSFGVGGRDLWVLRLDGMGGVVWQKTLGGSGEELVRGVLPTPDGGFVAGGYGDGAYVLKMDASGGVVWQRGYRGTSVSLHSIQTTSDGGYVFTGNVNGKWAIVKLTPLGNIVWQKTFGDSQGYSGGSILQTSDGGYLASANVEVQARGVEFALLRLDSGGNRIWQRTYGGPAGEWVCYPYCLREASDGNFLVAGWTYSFGTGGGDPSFGDEADAWVLRVFTNGAISSQCDPQFGASPRSPSVSSPRVKAEGRAYTISPSSGAVLDPGATVSPGGLETMTQCSA